MTPTEKTSNDVATRQLDKTAKLALLADIEKDWSKVKALASEASKAELKGANLMRLIGIKIQEVTGYQQLTFSDFRALEESFPKSFGFKTAKFCVKLATTYQEPLKSIEQVRLVQKELFVLTGEMPTPVKQITEQKAHGYNPWSELVSKTSTLTSVFDEIEKKTPLAEWDRQQLQTFINETKPIAERYQAARVRLEEMAA